MIEIEDLSASDLKTLISEVVSEELKKHFSQSLHDGELISRQDAAKYFKVTLSTIDAWRRKGILKPYKIGHLIFFRKSELQMAARPIDY